jgi:hypothetical protein
LLLNLPSIIREFGPLHNLWEGGGMGEKILRYVKKDWNGLRCNWQKNRMTKVHKKLAVIRMNYKTDRAIASLYDNGTDEENFIEEDDSTLQNSAIFKGNRNLKRYKDRNEFIEALQKGLPLSILKHKETYYSITKGGEIIHLKHGAIHSTLCGLHYFEWEVSDHALLGIDLHLNDQTEYQYCILLPKLQPDGLPIKATAKGKENVYTLIESEWHVIQPDGLIELPKVQGAHYTYK